MVKDVEDLVTSIFGKDVLPILKYILKKKEVSNEELSNKLKINPNTLRRMLYLLQEHNIVSARKVQNGKLMRFEYYWRLNVNSLESLKEKLIRYQIYLLEKRLENMEDYIFECPMCGLKLSFEEAMQYDFRCPEDGEMLIQKENKEKERILKELERLKKLLKKIKGQSS